MPKIPPDLPETVDVEQIVADCHTLGIVGERDLLLALYVVGTSRLLDKPLSAIVQGRSSSGKSYTVSEVARLFPPKDVIYATRMTPQALYHMGSVAHKFVVAGERSRVQDDGNADATAALRQLQSEGRIVKQITVKGEGGFETQEVAVEGPIAYVETTTIRPGAIFPEDLNRALLLGTDESEEQTRAILAKLAGRYRAAPGSADAEAIVMRHHEFQSQLERRVVSIPFADRLMEAIPAKRIEARRAGQQILSVIEAVALLHQRNRQPDDEGRLVATAADYHVAVQILRSPLGASLGVGASAAQLYQKLADHFGNNKAFTTAQVQQLDAASDRAVRNWLAELADHDCIDQVKAAVGPKPATWRLNGRTPEETVLPTPEAIGLKPECRKSRNMTAVPASVLGNKGFPACRKAGSGKVSEGGER